MTNEKNMTFVPAVYALPDLGDSSQHSLPAASPDNIPLYACLLPYSITTWDQDEQRAYLKDRIREHYIRNRGTLPLIGRITHYLTHLNPNEPAILCSVHGDPIPPSSGTSIPDITFVPYKWTVTRRIFVNSICSKDTNTFH